MFLMVFSYVARALQLLTQSLNNNNWPNKNNDVITDLGGEGDFPMFRYAILKPAQAASGAQAVHPHPDSETPPHQLP